ELAHEVEGGAHRAQCIVLVNGGDTEDRHQRVADELLDGPAVPCDHGAGDVVEAAHDAAERFRIELLAQARPAGDVPEQDRDDLAPWRLGDRERGAALRAELRCRAVLLAAVGACPGHEGSLYPHGARYQGTLAPNVNA